MSDKNEDQNLEKNTVELFPLQFGNGDWDSNYDLKLVRGFQLTLDPPDSPQPLSEFLKTRAQQNDSSNSTPKSVLNDSFCIDNSTEDDDDYPSSSQENSCTNDQTDANIPPPPQQIFQTPQQKPKINDLMDEQEPARNSLFSAIKYKALLYKTPTKDAKNPSQISIMSSIQKNDSNLLTQQKSSNSNQFNSYSTPKDSKLFSSGLSQPRKGLIFKDFNTKVKENAENHLDSIKEIEYSPKNTNKHVLTDVSNEKIDDNPGIFKQSENYRKNSPENENLDSAYSKVNHKRQTSPNIEDDFQKFQQKIDTRYELLNSRQSGANLNEISSKKVSPQIEASSKNSINKNCDKNYYTDSKSCRNNLCDIKPESLQRKAVPPLNEVTPTIENDCSNNNYFNEPKNCQTNQFDNIHESSNSQQNSRQIEASLNEVPPSNKQSKNYRKNSPEKPNFDSAYSKLYQNRQTSPHTDDDFQKQRIDTKLESFNSRQIGNEAPENEAKNSINKNYFNYPKSCQNNLSDIKPESIKANLNGLPQRTTPPQNEVAPSIKNDGYINHYFKEPKNCQKNQIDNIHESSNSQQNARQIEASLNEVQSRKVSPQHDLLPKSSIVESRSSRNYPEQIEELNRNKNYVPVDEFKKPDSKPSCSSLQKIESKCIQNAKYIPPGSGYSQINDKQRPVLNSNNTPNNKKPESLNNNAKASIQFPLLKSAVKPTLIGRTLQIQNVEYLIKSKLGEGGSCEVYEGTNIENSKVFAIKCVNLAVDPITAKGYMTEIQLLAKLQTSDYVIKMFSYERMHDKLYVIMERGEMDLGQLIENSKNLHIAMIVYYWIEMLTAVKCIHDNGIIHSDLKPANFLLVKGRLKLIDFGIASVVNDDCTSIIKNTQAGTLNYISPEALIDTRDFSNANSDMNINISYKSDVWSLGCILYKFLYGKTPFQHITNKMAKFTILTDKNHIIDYPNTIKIPPKLLTTLKKCLIFEMRKRPSVDELLKVNYICFNNCD